MGYKSELGGGERIIICLSKSYTYQNLFIHLYNNDSNKIITILMIGGSQISLNYQYMNVVLSHSFFT